MYLIDWILVEEYTVSKWPYFMITFWAEVEK